MTCERDCSGCEPQRTEGQDAYDTLKGLMDRMTEMGVRIMDQDGSPMRFEEGFDELDNIYWWLDYGLDHVFPDDAYPADVHFNADMLVCFLSEYRGLLETKDGRNVLMRMLQVLGREV